MFEPQQLDRLICCRSKSAETLELTQIFGVELPASVVCNRPNGPYCFAADIERYEQPLLRQRGCLQQIWIPQLPMGEEQRRIRVEYIAARAKVALRATAYVRAPSTGDGWPVEGLAVVAEQADAGRIRLEHIEQRVG